ncbi:septum site-determining protein MinC [Bacillus lacus]|uniref:Probable septum site-determining protein MinC n=1 Tax=Metabacillus lacus TaxID=1983721 RepID=A0A7X2LYZ7_9BACI|nr:septum site-determining protein MinC [Metabacillus lacus]
MKAQKQQYVTIKGTKDGLTLHLDDNCSFEQILLDLEDMLSLKQYIQEDVPLISVRVKAGNRLLTSLHEDSIREKIGQKRNLIVDSIESNVMTKESAEQLRRETEIVSVARMIRSGQVFQVEGDLLLIGDVNPGGTVIAGGNIFIMGALKGIAHAGYSGNQDAVIAASLLMPSQLRISGIFNRSPDHIPEEGSGMECAYLEGGEMIIDRLQNLAYLRPALTRFEGGM